MEANNGPVDFERSWSVIKLRYSNHDVQESSTLFRSYSYSFSCVLFAFYNPQIFTIHSPFDYLLFPIVLSTVLLPHQILELAEDELNQPRFISMCGNTVHGQKFIHEFMEFIQQIASRTSQERVLQGLDDGYEYHGFKDNGRRFQLDRAPFTESKKLKQLPVSE